MRCPKCGYISFDTLGSCKKCKKNIGELVEELEGTVYESPAPVFLHFEPGATSSAVLENEVDDEAVTGDEIDELQEIISGAEEEQDTFSLDEGSKPEGTIAFEDFEEVKVANEMVLDDGISEDVATESDDLQLDFGDIDISDLAPPETDAEVSVTESLTLDEDTEETVDMPDNETPAPSLVAPGSSLEDLHVDNLDFDAPAPLVSGSKVGDKLMPSVKTGTALDDFDIDLGELIAEEK